LIEKLPHDLHKLEWLTQLDRAQLEDLLLKFECRKESRSAVVKAVKGVLSPEEPADAPDENDAALEAFGKLLRRFVDLLGRIGATSSAGEMKERARIALSEALGKLETSPGR